jgi:hypothetical protein
MANAQSVRVSCEGLSLNLKSSCIRNVINIKNLKTFSCQLIYKILMDDLEDKLARHNAHKYDMSTAEANKYQGLLDDLSNACIPKDPVVDRIERDEAR